VARLLAPFNYVYLQNGKKMRDQFISGINHWYKLETSLASKISVLWDKLHNASLVIDDIEDYSELRRGKPAAHLVYGVPLSINAANYMYFEVLGDLMELKNPEDITIFTEQMLILHHGQGMDLYWRDHHEFKESEDIISIQNEEIDFSSQFPKEEDYMDIIVKKTSGQFVFAFRLMNAFSQEKDKDGLRLGELVGLCFQIRDDLMNLVSAEYTDTKGFCEDISEGKLSFPVIHALNKNSFSKEKRLRLWNILRMKTTDPEIKEEALDILEESGAISYTETLLFKLKLEIKAEIDKLGGNPVLDEKLKNFWG